MSETKALTRLRSKVARERARSRRLLRAYHKAGTMSSSTAERAHGEEALAHMIIGWIDKELKNT